MMNDVPEYQCPYCDLYFSVIWRYDPYADDLAYCPRCGTEMDYAHCENDPLEEAEDEKLLEKDPEELED